MDALLVSSNMSHLQLALLSSILVAFAVYTFKSVVYGKNVSARIQKQGGSPLLNEHAMEFIYWCLRPVGRIAAGLRISPDVLSWLCLVLGFIAGAYAANGSMATAGMVGIFSALFDALDGMVARSRGIASDAGEVLDAAIDRYAEFFFLGGLTIYYRFHPGLMALMLLALLGSYMVSYSQAKGDSLQVSVPKGWMRRPERALYLNGGAFLSPLISQWLEPITSSEAGPMMHYPIIFCVSIVAVISNLSAIQRYVSMYREIKVRESRKK